MIRPLLAAALVCAVPCALHAQATGLSGGGPVEVTSDNGMEWRQNEQVIIATGNARAVRGTVTVTADQLLAYYRKKAAPPGVPAGANPAAAAGPGAAPAKPAAAAAGGLDTGNNEIYRLQANGHVHIVTPTDQAFADHAVYDIDQGLLVMTGNDLHIITPSETLSARDSMEYYSQKHMSVARGDAVVNTKDGRRIQADVLVGYTADPAASPTAPVQKVSAPAAKAGTDPLGGAGGKLQRVDAFGHVEIRTATETIRADRGVYVPDSGIARLAGNVRITRGQNQLNGDEAITNLKTGVSTITRAPGHRVEGLVVPSEGAGAAKPGAAKPGTTSPAAAKSPGTPR